eukprot:scpid49237/ scgid5830/ 
MFSPATSSGSLATTFLVLLLPGLSVAQSSFTLLSAYFSNGGVAGHVDISGSIAIHTRASTPEPITITLNSLTGFPSGGSGALRWGVNERAFRPGVQSNACGTESVGGLWDPEMKATAQDYATNCLPTASSRFTDCAAGDLSGKFGPPSSSGTFADSSALRLIDFLGRSLVLRYSNGTALACANIVYVYPDGNAAGTSRPSPTTSCQNMPAPSAFQAQFVWPVAGDMLFRYYSRASSVIGVNIAAQLYDVTGSGNLTGLSWTAHPAEISHAEMTRSKGARCTGAGMPLVNYTAAYQAEVSVGATPERGHQILSFSGNGSHAPVNGSSIKSIILWQGSEALACANVYSSKLMSVRASFPVTGNTVTYTQQSPLDTVLRQVSTATTLGSTGGTLRIRNSPVNPLARSTQHGSDNGMCSSTGLLFSLTARTAPVSVTDGTATSSVGCVESHTLFGYSSVVHRSATIESMSGSSPIQQCATILPLNLPNATRTLQARLTFPSDSEVQGSIYFTQYAYDDGSYSDTYALFRLGNSSATTSGHNFHVHVERVLPYNNSLCGVTGGHYNPLNVNLSSATGYSTACGPRSQLRCEVGDLSGKIGQLTIDGTARMYPIAQLPLEGPNSVFGRSIVIHAANGGAPRIACANIIGVAAADAYIAFRVPAGGFMAGAFSTAVQTWLSTSSAVEQINITHVTSTVDPGTNCVFVNFAIESSSETVSQRLARDVLTAPLGIYSHRGSCLDPSLVSSAASPSILAGSSPWLLIFSLCTAIRMVFLLLR